MDRKDVVTYSTGAKILHWLIALLVISMLCVTFFLGDLPESMQGTAFMVHKSFGLTILALMLMRVFYILYSGKPSLPASVATWQKFLARSVQYALYVFVISMALSGWIMATAADKAPVFFGLFKVPFPGIIHSKPLAMFMNQTHKTIAWVIIALVSLHVLGALKHYFIDKDGVVQRMWFGR